MGESKAVKIVGGILLVATLLGVVGLVDDAFAGFRFSTAAKTLGGLVLGLVLLGSIRVLAEGGLDRATADDRTTDPLVIRLGRLLLGLAIAVAMLILGAIVYRLFT